MARKRNLRFSGTKRTNLSCQGQTLSSTCDTRSRAMKRPRPPAHVTLARALSKLGAASRAEATRLILAGRVRVNGHVVTDLRRLVHPERAAIAIDGTPIGREQRRVIMLHKPRGVVTTRS